MSSRKTRLPQMQSPAHLDEKILAESRRLAPERKSFFPMGWVPAMAAACGVAVIVVATRPLFQNVDPPADQPVQATVATEARKLQAVQESAVSSGSAFQAGESTVQNRAATIQSDQASPVAAGESAPSAAAMKMEATVQSDPVPEMEASPGLSMDQEVSSASVAEEAMMSEVPETVSRAQDAMTDPLSRVYELIEQDQLDEARKLLEELNRECPECGYPDSIEELNG